MRWQYIGGGKVRGKFNLPDCQSNRPFESATTMNKVAKCQEVPPVLLVGTINVSVDYDVFVNPIVAIDA